MVRNVATAHDAEGTPAVTDHYGQADHHSTPGTLTSIGVHLVFTVLHAQYTPASP